MLVRALLNNNSQTYSFIMTVGKHLLHFTLISESNKTNVPSLGPQSQKQTNNMVGKKKKKKIRAE